MTTVSQIITDAFRQSNLIPVGTSPAQAQQNEALRYINRIVLSVLGNEAGENLSPLGVGSNNISRPTGYPYFDDLLVNEWFVPENTRIMFNLGNPVSLYLHPNPDDGTRIGVVDVSGNFSTNNLTLKGNGRNIEAASELVLSTNGTANEWMYRADTGNWSKTTNLLIGDVFPFPEDFDDMFITMLAIRINPAYGRMIDAQSAAVLDRSRNQLRARYATHKEIAVERALVALTNYDARYGFYAYLSNGRTPNTLFDLGIIGF
jgi:hypothetical protein